MSDVLFTGKFELSDALAKFNEFASAIEGRLTKINQLVSKSGAAGATGAAAKNDTAVVDAETKRQQKITDQHINHSIAQAKKETKAKEAEKKQQTKDEADEAKRQQRITDQQLAYNIRAAKDETKAREKEIGQQALAMQRLFTGLTVGGFALQRFGGFLERNLAAPLMEATRSLYDTATAVNDFEETLRVRGGKSKDQIEEIYNVVKKVSDLPNLERSDVLTIFSRLVEVTKGGITANELEKIGGGLSKITTSLEAGEKRAFYGQLQDILGGGNVANIQKTLSLVPLLKSEYDKLKESATVPTDDKTLILTALSNLSVLPNVDTISASVKRLRNEVFEFKRRLSEVYKEDIKILVDFIVTRVIPVIDRLITWFEKGGEAAHIFGIALVGILIVLPKLITILGSFAIAIGGVGFAFETLKLSSISLSTVGGNLTKLLTAIPGLLNPISIAIIALIALITYLTVTNLGGFRDSISKSIGSIGEMVSALGRLDEALGKAFNAGRGDNLTPSEKAGFFASVAAGVGQLISALVELAALIANMPTMVMFDGLANGIQLVIDLINDKLPLAIAKFNLRMLEMQKRINDTFPLMGDINNLGKRLLGYDIDKEIEKAKKSVTDLGGTYDSTTGKAKVGIKDVAVAHHQWSVAVDKTSEAVKKLTEALREQSKANLDAMVASSKSIADYNAKKTSTGLTDEVRRMREKAFDMDLSDPTKAAQALEDIKKSNALNLKAAQIMQGNSTADALREVFKQNREALVKLAKDETDETILDLYTSISMMYLKAETDPKATVSEEAINKLLAAVTGVPARKLDIIKRSLDLQMSAVSLARKTAGSINDQLDAAERDNQEQLTQYQKKTGEIEKKRAEIERLRPLNAALAGREATAKTRYDEMTDIGKDIDAIKSLTQLNDDLAQAYTDYREARDLALKAQIAVIDATDDTALEKLQKKQEAQQKFSEDMANASQANTAAYNDAIKRILGDKGNDSKRIRDLLTSFGDEAKGVLEMGQELARAGVSINGAQIKKALDNYNTIIQETANVLSQGAFKKIADSAGDIAGVAGKLRGAGVDTGSLTDFLRKFVGTENKPMTRAEIDAMLLESEGILNLLKNIDVMGSLTDPADQADAQLAIKRLIAYVEQMKAARKTLNDLKDANVERGQIVLSELEHQQDLNDIIRDQLELEQQILDIRRQRSEIPEAPILSKIIGVLSGAEAAAREQQIKILENQKKTAKLTLDIELQKLQISQWRLENEIKMMNISQEEKDRLIKESQDLYKKEVEQIKKKGELEQELLDERTKSISDELSGGGILGSIIGLFKKKKKKPDTTADDVHGGVTAIGGPLISDPDDDGSAKNAKKQGDWLDQLTGKMGKARDLIMGIGAALSNMQDLSFKGIIRALAEELKALSKYATIKALEYAAIAVSALVFGDIPTAKRAGKAAALWTAVAVASGVAGHFLGKVGAEDAANSDADKSRKAGVGSGDQADASRDKQVLKQQALSVILQLDIRTDDGIIIRKNVKAVNGNTELTTLIGNGQQGWYFPPSP